MSSAEAVKDAIATRLAMIQTANGYRTDAGLNRLLLGLETPDRGEPAPLVGLFMPDEDTRRDRPNTHNRDMMARFLIPGWVIPAGSDQVQPLLDLLADIKQAVFKYDAVPEITALVMDHYYAGASFTPRRDGSTFAQLVVEGVFKWREVI